MTVGGLKSPTSVIFLNISTRVYYKEEKSVEFGNFGSLFEFTRSIKQALKKHLLIISIY